MPRVERKAFADLLKNPDATGAALLVGLVDVFSLPELIEWDPETLQAEIESDLGPVTRESLDKIQALLTVLSSDVYKRSLPAFLSVVRALNGEEPLVRYYEPADVSEICRALAEIFLIDPPDQSFAFSSDIVGYIQTRLSYEGFAKAPKLLATYVPVEDLEGRINEALDGEGIDYKAWWDGQAGKRSEADAHIRAGLGDIVSQVASLPLRHARPKAAQELQDRAASILRHTTSPPRPGAQGTETGI